MFEKIIYTDSSEQTAEIFGNFDSNVAVIERAFGVEIVNRDTERANGDAIIIKGESSDAVLKAHSAVEYLKNMVMMGSELSEQSVGYVVGTIQSGEELENFGDDCICVTTKGKPIKAKTVGQKKYVELIKKNTVVLGLGPAGTGKTFLAVAAASTAL